MSIIRKSGTAGIEPQLDLEPSISLIDIGYPLRLSSNQVLPDDNETLNGREFWALQNTLAFIRKLWHRYALELFVDFYTEHHELINRFRSKRTGKICAMNFSVHGKAIFKTFREIVENGLQNWGRSVNQINEFTKIHVSHDIGLSDIELLSGAFKEFILRKCDGITSPTVHIALDKLYQELLDQHRVRNMIGIDDD